MTVSDSQNHPIDPAVRLQIKARLAAIEAEHQVRVLYACESGSRGWGFASPDSDYDVRFIYVHPLSWYLSVNTTRDVIELPIDDELDISGWELRKAMGLLKKGNATLIEWLDSPVVYRTHLDFLPALRRAVRQTYQPQRAFHHYAHMARKTYREHLCGERVHLKKYFYALRPLLATLWLEQQHGVVPMRFAELVKVIVKEPPLRVALEQLLTDKRAASETQDRPPLPIINAFIERELVRLERVMPPLPENPDFSVLDHLLMNTVLGG